MLNQHQQVLDFLKVRGGCASLRELQHFSLQMLERLQLQGYVDICKSKQNGYGYEVILRESRFKLSNIKTEVEVEVKKVSSPSISIRKVDSTKTKKIDGKFSSIRDSIVSIIKNSKTPLNAFEIQKHFPSLALRSIYHQLIILEAEEKIFSARGKQKYYAHQKNLLEDLPISPPGSEKNLTHLAESDRKNKIIALLANGAELYQLEMAEALGIKHCSYTYRSLLKKMVEEGILISRRIGQNSRIYYSLKESRKKANITISKGKENYEAL